ncbi:MAG: hypothetical protein V3V01_16230 [Acidimicrobiales bacterium]
MSNTPVVTANQQFETRPPGEPFWTKARIVVTIIMVGIVAFWIYGLGPWRPLTNPDSLDDRTYATTAEAICAVAAEDINALPQAASATSTGGRADTIEEANGFLTRMLLGMQAERHPDETEHDKVILDKWLGDWNTLLDDRVVHVERLRTEGDIRFEVTQVGSSSVASRVNGLALVNGMPSCGLPTDL